MSDMASRSSAAPSANELDEIATRLWNALDGDQGPLAVDLAVLLGAARDHECAACEARRLDAPCAARSSAAGAGIETAQGFSVRDFQRINAERSARWMAGSPGWTTLEIAGELAGEVGELANVCKKLRRSELGVPGNKVSDDELLRQARGEMADVLIVLALVASKLGVDLQDAVRDTFNAKSEQMGFPERLGESQPSALLARQREGEHSPFPLRDLPRWTPLYVDGEIRFSLTSDGEYVMYEDVECLASSSPSSPSAAPEADHSCRNCGRPLSLHSGALTECIGYEPRPRTQP